MNENLASKQMILTMEPTETDFDTLRLAEHMMTNSTSLSVTAFETLMHSDLLPASLFHLAQHASLALRDASRQLNALTELFGREDAASQVRMLSYDAVQFFDTLAHQMDLHLSNHLHGHITFRLAKGSETSAVFDGRRMATIVYHLVSNALQHGRTDNKNVIILFKHKGGVLELSVQDYGGGIPAHQQPSLMRKFSETFQLHSQSVGLLPPRIVGLGLPLCHKMVTDMDGQLCFRNKQNSALFTVLLPQPKDLVMEPSTYYPDDTLLYRCMSPSLFLPEKQKEHDTMTITYELGNSLYVNLTNRCSNACTFCVRNQHDDVNGKDNLWLDREPTLEEIKSDFLRRDIASYDSVVFCGYGEPTERFEEMLAIARWLKEQHPSLAIRLNTNGHANLICGRDVTPELKGCFDCISISLNAENAEKYQERCVCRYGGVAAFEGLKEFARLAKRYVPEVVFSVVDVLDQDEIDHCRQIAEDLGVTFRVREYIA